MTVTLYAPGGKFGKLNTPLALLVVLRWMFTAAWSTFTVAPGTTAPLGSVTVPEMAPLELFWAHSIPVPSTSTANHPSPRARSSFI
ncbi:MAG: hypothetical protein ACRD17_09235, partial [Terriglobales bacterium]